MIKKYLEFIKEDFETKSKEDFNSLGEWVEYLYDLYKDDEEKLSNLKSIVNRYFNIKGEETLRTACNMGIYKSWAEGSTIGSKSLINFSSGLTLIIKRQMLSSTIKQKSISVPA